MWIEVACEALQNGRRLQLSYEGWERVVEVHTVGETTAGNICMSVWQVRGGGNSNELVGWKLMKIDKASSVVEVNERSEAPRDGYVRNASPFTRIICQI